ncbi:MAG: AbrB/MazE/SpoVT family DNA-binding domain-containing protein [Clostridia bacterium]|nr:AbrB/MazE/SpoVT family DNA-binding domain-containing protein [Clostridia bacterium]
MKATGIVRRIDELGRVVIPKEIRKTLRLSSGDPLEIYTDRDELLFRKYSPIRSIDGFAEEFSAALREISGYSAAVCDTDFVVACHGAKEFTGKPVSAETERVMRERRTMIINATEGGSPLNLTSDAQKPFSAEVIAPVIVNGDCIGACVLFSFDEGVRMRETDVKLAKMSAELLSRRFAE